MILLQTRLLNPMFFVFYNAGFISFFGPTLNLFIILEDMELKLNLNFYLYREE